MTAATSLLDVSALSVRYGRGRRKPPFTALRDVTLTIAPGEVKDLGDVKPVATGRSD